MANLHAFSILLASDTPTILHNTHVMAGFQCKPVAECQTTVGSTASRDDGGSSGDRTLIHVQMV